MHSEKLTQAEIEKGSAESKIQQLNSLVEAKNTELAMVLSVTFNFLITHLISESQTTPLHPSPFPSPPLPHRPRRRSQ